MDRQQRGCAVCVTVLGGGLIAALVVLHPRDPAATFATIGRCGGRIGDLDFDGSSQFLAASVEMAKDKWNVEIWDVSNRIRHASIEVGSAPNAIDLSADAACLAVSTDDWVRVFLVKGGMPVFNVPLHGASFDYSVLSPDSRYVAAFVRFRGLIVWDVGSGMELGSRTLGTDAVTAMCLSTSPLGIWYATRSGGCQFWTWAPDRIEKRFLENTMISTFVLAPSGETCAVILSGDKIPLVAMACDLEGREIATVAWPPKMQLCTIDPTCSWGAGLNVENELMLVSIVKGTVEKIADGAGKFCCLAVAPDGEHLAIGVRNGEMLLLNVLGQ